MIMKKLVVIFSVLLISANVFAENIPADGPHQKFRASSGDV